jgi:hypothetical protein
MHSYRSLKNGLSNSSCGRSLCERKGTRATHSILSTNCTKIIQSRSPNIGRRDSRQRILRTSVASLTTDVRLISLPSRRTTSVFIPWSSRPDIVWRCPFICSSWSPNAGIRVCQTRQLLCFVGLPSTGAVSTKLLCDSTNSFLPCATTATSLLELLRRDLLAPLNSVRIVGVSPWAHPMLSF